MYIDMVDSLPGCLDFDGGLMSLNIEVSRACCLEGSNVVSVAILGHDFHWEESESWFKSRQIVEG